MAGTLPYQTTVYFYDVYSGNCIKRKIHTLHILYAGSLMLSCISKDSESASIVLVKLYAASNNMINETMINITIAISIMVSQSSSLMV